MSANLLTPAQIETRKLELKAKRQAAGVTNRLWVSNTGHCACDEHGGRYLTAAIETKPNARKHTTPLAVWKAEVVRFDLMDELNEDLYCDDCFKGLFPVYGTHVVGEVKVGKPAPVKVAKPEVVEAPVEETVEAPAKAAKKFFVWSDGEKSVCAKHTGPILKKAIAEAPRKRKHALSNGDWAKVEETADNVCGRCLKLAKGKVEVTKPAAKPEKKTLKKPVAKGSEQFYAIRFGDGYYMASYSSQSMDYTVAFSEARRFKTYDGAEKIINRMREEYDAEDLTPLISVMRVTIDHDDRLKTRAQRIGVLSF